MKSTVYYFSQDGNTKNIAERVAKGTSIDVCRLVSLKKYPQNGFRFFLGGMDATLKRCPKLEPLTMNPEGYDTIILATPVWASTFVPAIRSFLKNHNLSGRKIVLLATSSGGDADKCFKALRAMLGESQILGEFCVKSPVADHEKEADAVVEKVKKLLNE